MSRRGLQAAVNRIALDLLTLAQAVLDDDAVSVNEKVGRNTLRDSALSGDLETRVDSVLGGDPVIKALFNHYVVYLEWTRPPRYKKQPPIRVLKGWAEKNGIPTDAETLYRISYAIWRDGHRGRPIFATLDSLVDRHFENWADRLFAAIFEELDKFFK